MITFSARWTREIKGAFSCLRQFLAPESPLKMMKNAFYFTSFFFSNFCLDVAKQLDWKDKATFKIYDITTWNKQLQYTYYPISQEVKAMKLHQLIDYDMRNILLEKAYTKCGGETSPRTFSEKLKFTMSLDQTSKVLYSVFLLYAKLRVLKYIETKLQIT